MSERLRYWLAGTAALLWFASFFLPAVRINQGWQMGWEIAAAGWAGPVVGQFGWYANVIMIPSLGMLALGESPSDLDKISKLGAVLFLLWLNTLFWTDMSEVGGRILARGVGYYAWMASLLIVWGGMFILNRSRLKDMGADEKAVEPDETLDQEDGAAEAPPVRSALHDTDPPFQIPAAGL
jgi:hypothetical protein